MPKKIYCYSELRPIYTVWLYSLKIAGYQQKLILPAGKGGKASRLSFLLSPLPLSQETRCQTLSQDKRALLSCTLLKAPKIRTNIFQSIHSLQLQVKAHSPFHSLPRSCCIHSLPCSLKRALSMRHI